MVEESEPEMRRIGVSGVNVAYRRAGAGESLVYLHGAGLTKRWLPLSSVLAEEFDVVAPEHPGFGDTPRPRWYRSVDDIAVHYADFSDRIGLAGPIHLVGHSFGAMVAGAFAALFPERVRTLTLIAPGPLPTANPEFTGPEDPPDDFDALLFNDNQAAYPEFANADDEGDLLAADDDSFATPLPGLLPAPATLYRRIARINAPVQVLIPDDDRLFPEKFAEQWAELLGGAPLITIPGTTYQTGHLLVVQEPEAIARRIAILARA